MARKIINHLSTVIFIIALFLLILTFSIGLPIYFRPFYYLQIKTLNMEELTGYSYIEIKEAYDQVLNYLTLNRAFGTGILKYSFEGESHFADCKILFNLNLYVLVGSFIVVTTLFILNKYKIVSLQNYLKFPPYFYTSIIMFIVPLVLVIIVSIDFDRAFKVFHSIFFPGKTNWIFDPNKDEIIKVMPEEFFMNCGILIAVSVISISIILLIIAIIKRIKLSKKLK